MIPGLVLLTCHKDNKAQDAMGVSIFASSCGFVGIFAAMIDLHLSWKRLLGYLALLYISVSVLAMVTLHRVFGAVELDHWLFLAKSPLIVAKFFLRLPLDGRDVAASVVNFLHELVLSIMVGDTVDLMLNRMPIR